MERYPLYCGGREAGELTVAEEPMYVTFQAVCRPAEPGLWRAFAVGEQGELRLGVLAPENGAFAIRRRVSRQTARPVGRIVRGEARPCGEEKPGLPWEPMGNPAERFGGALPGRLLADLAGGLTKLEGNCRLAALPYDCRRPFPLTELFCFARIQRIGESFYTVFAFDPCGQPVMPGAVRRRSGGSGDAG